MMSEHQEDFVVEEAQEGVPPPAKTHDEELSAYSESVQKRINEATAKAARLERELREAREFGNRAADIAKRAVAEVTELRGRTATSESAMVENLVASLDSELTVAKSELKDAYEAQDPVKIADATARVSSVAADLRRAQVAKAGHLRDLEEAKAEAERKAKSPPPPPRQTSQPPAPKAQEWLSRNADWFNKDPEKTRTAIAADRYVAMLGLDPNSDAYYEEVDKMISSRHGGVTQGGQNRDQRPLSQAATPAGRSQPAAPGARKVTLTASELATARRIGVSPEDYAKAKLSGGVV